MQYALRKLSLGCPEVRTLQPGCCWAVLGEYGVLPTGEVSHCIQTPFSPPQGQHGSYSMGISTESSQFSQEDEEDLVIAGQCAHRAKKKEDTSMKEQCLVPICLKNRTVGNTG